MNQKMVLTQESQARSKMPSWLARLPTDDLYLNFHYCTATHRWLIVTWRKAAESMVLTQQSHCRWCWHGAACHFPDLSKAICTQSCNSFWPWPLTWEWADIPRRWM
jgi:hypothetical protein